MATAVLSGVGIAPQAGRIFDELSAVTRRAFVPRLFVQMYNASPGLFFLWGNAQRAAGGMSQITIPMQGQSMVRGQFTDFGGGFSAPAVMPGIQAGQWNLSYWVVPVPLMFGESVIQSTEVVVPILKARMNDVYAVTKQNVAGNLYGLSTARGQYPNTLFDAFDDGTNTPIYGGINRTVAGNQAYKGQYINAGAGSLWDTKYSTATLGWTRKSMSALITRINDVAGGEAPTCGIMNPSDHATLNGDFIGVEQINVRSGDSFTMDTGVRSSFPNLNVAGVPIFADHFCPVGNMIFLNTKYTNMYISEDAAMDFSGFHSLVPVGQIGQQGIMVLGYQVVSAKSSSGAWVFGFGGASF